MSQELKECRLRAMTSKKETLFIRVQQMYSLIPNLNNPNTLNTFKIKFKTLEKTISDFMQTIDDINVLNLELDPEYSPNFQTIDSFMDLVGAVQIAADENFNQTNSVAPISTTNVTRNPTRSIPRLPKLELRSFSGDMKQWPLFYECFKSLIHDNSDLNDTDKINFLMGKLSDSALELCSGILPVASNYTIIWEMLVDKYQDKRKLAECYLDTLLEFKYQQIESSHGLDSFLEKFVTASEAIKKLGIDDLFDFTLTYLALTKLNSQTNRDFEMFRTNKKEIPKFTQLVEFVKEQSKVLSSPKSKDSHSKTGSNKHSSSSSSNTHNAEYESSQTFVANDSSQQNQKCNLCNREAHALYRCPQFLKNTPIERYQIVKSENLCFNCLGTHKIATCTSKSTCSTCNSKHNSLLHFPKPNQSNNYRSEDSANHLPSNCSSSWNKTATEIKVSESDPTSTLYAMNNSKSHSKGSVVLMPTAIVNVHDANGKIHKIRALLDSCSQRNIITSSCCKRLQLPVHKINSSIVGLGTHVSYVKEKTSLTISSRLNSKRKYSLNASVVEKVSKSLPDRKISFTPLKYLHGLPLADETFHQPGKIDAILGTDIFSHSLKNNKIFGPRGSPTAIETIFGYVVMGSVPTVSPYYNSHKI